MNTDLTTHDPTTNGPPPAAAVPKVNIAELDAWFAELERLRRERPAPTDAERLPDWNWYFEQRNSGGLTEYAGRFVAIYHQRVVGDDIDPTWLELSLARKHADINPDRFVIEFVG